LSRLAPEIAISDTTRLVAGGQGGRKVVLRQLLEDGRALGTMLAWIGMFASLMIYFFMQKWLAVAPGAGRLDAGAAITATTVGLAGGIFAASSSAVDGSLWSVRGRIGSVRVFRF